MSRLLDIHSFQFASRAFIGVTIIGLGVGMLMILNPKRSLVRRFVPWMRTAIILVIGCVSINLVMTLAVANGKTSCSTNLFCAYVFLDMFTICMGLISLVTSIFLTITTRSKTITWLSILMILLLTVVGVIGPPPLPMRCIDQSPQPPVPPPVPLQRSPQRNLTPTSPSREKSAVRSPTKQDPLLSDVNIVPAVNPAPLLLPGGAEIQPLKPVRPLFAPVQPLSPQPTGGGGGASRSIGPSASTATKRVIGPSFQMTSKAVVASPSAVAASKPQQLWGISDEVLHKQLALSTEQQSSQRQICPVVAVMDISMEFLSTKAELLGYLFQWIGLLNMVASKKVDYPYLYHIYKVVTPTELLLDDAQIFGSQRCVLLHVALKTGRLEGQVITGALGEYLVRKGGDAQHLSMLLLYAMRPGRKRHTDMVKPEFSQQAVKSLFVAKGIHIGTSTNLHYDKQTNELLFSNADEVRRVTDATLTFWASVYSRVDIPRLMLSLNAYPPPSTTTLRVLFANPRDKAMYATVVTSFLHQTRFKDAHSVDRDWEDVREEDMVAYVVPPGRFLSTARPRQIMGAMGRKFDLVFYMVDQVQQGGCDLNLPNYYREMDSKVVKGNRQVRINIRKEDTSTGQEAETFTLAELPDFCSILPVLLVNSATLQ